MAIYFNDKLLHPKEDGNEVEQMYYEGLKKVSKLFKNGNIVLVRPGVTRTWDSQRISTRPIPAMAIPDETPLYVDSIGAVTVRYSKVPPQRNGKQIKFSTARIWVEERRTITEQEKDLAWYIIEATDFVRNGILQIDDPQREIIGKASAVKRIAKVDGFLLNEESPIYNKKALTFIADKFGLDVPMNYDIESMAFLIREAVLGADKIENHPTLNIDKFLATANKLAKTEKQDDDFKMKDSYTKEELESMHQKELNSISKELSLPKPPQCNKVEQIERILELQAQPA